MRERWREFLYAGRKISAIGGAQEIEQTKIYKRFWIGWMEDGRLTMREILFRAKRIDNGEWVEGQYAFILNPLTESGEPIKHLICNGTNIFNDEIDPETLCQYTGLKDKNGNRIWENDIVRSGTNMVVKWSERFAGWCLYQNRWMYEHFFGEAVDERDCEVVGNVFDNPELLKK